MPEHLPSPIVWVDIETTGLDPYRDTILEIAARVTGADLQPVGEPLHTLIRPSVRDLGELRMTLAAFQMHSKNGLLAELGDCDSWVAYPTVLEAQEWLCDYIRSSIAVLDPAHVHRSLGITNAVPERPPLGGSSVGFDKSFLRGHMPRVLDLLHYRIIDVSSMREFARRVWPNLELPPKSEAHRALPDIDSSIAHARWLRERMLAHG